MKKSLELLTLVAVFSFAAPDAALAQGRPTTGPGSPGFTGGGAGGAGGGAAARGQQVRQIVRTYTDTLRQNRRAAAQLARDLVAACQLVLALPEAQLDQLEQDLDAAYDAAKDAFEALPAVDQTEAKLKELIVGEMNLVFPNYTQDATQLAALATAAQAFADGVAPLELQIVAARAQFKQQLQALRP